MHRWSHAASVTESASASLETRPWIAGCKGHSCRDTGRQAEGQNPAAFKCHSERDIAILDGRSPAQAYPEPKQAIQQLAVYVVPFACRFGQSEGAKLNKFRDLSRRNGYCYDFLARAPESHHAMLAIGSDDCTGNAIDLYLGYADHFLILLRSQKIQ